MKSLKRSIKLFSIILVVLSLANCTEDAEGSIFGVPAIEDLSKINVSGNVVSLTIDSGNPNNANIESAIPFAVLKVFAEEELIAETTADQDGRYSFDRPIDLSFDKKLFIETSKTSFLPNVETLDPNKSSNQTTYLFKSNDSELELEYNGDEVTVSGKIKYSDDFIITAVNGEQNANGECDGGWRRESFSRRTNGDFSIIIPRSEDVTFSFGNLYGCKNSTPSNQIPTRFEGDTDLGLISDVIIPSHLHINITEIVKPDCFSESVLYINNDRIDLNINPFYRLCNNITQIETNVIDYQNKKISEKTYPIANDKLSIEFGECRLYDHKFSLKSSMGNFTEESKNIQIVEHIYRSGSPNQEGQSYNLEFQIGEEYTFKAYGRTFSKDKSIRGLAAFENLKEEFRGYSVFGNGSSTPFVIENGFLTGSIIVTQRVEDGPIIEIELDFQVPIIE